MCVVDADFAPKKPHRIVFSGYFYARKIIFCAQINGKVLRFVLAADIVGVGFRLLLPGFALHILVLYSIYVSRHQSHLWQLSAVCVMIIAFR